MHCRCFGAEEFNREPGAFSIAWDKPFYRYPVLHPIAWVLERLISTPATHHAHHAASTDDGIGYYKGNFGNMFFLGDVIFGTAFISRQYPRQYGISHYESDEWYAQLLWPIFKSKVEGSELSGGGPVVREDVPPVELAQVAAQGRQSFIRVLATRDLEDGRRADHGRFQCRIFANHSGPRDYPSAQRLRTNPVPAEAQEPEPSPSGREASGYLQQLCFYPRSLASRCRQIEWTPRAKSPS